MNELVSGLAVLVGAVIVLMIVWAIVDKGRHG